MLPDQDDAPEDISFSRGKADALQLLETAKSERKKQDDLTKAWRRKRNTLYKEQTEKKLLSMSVLVKADEELQKRFELPEDESEIDEESNLDSDSSLSDESLEDRIDSEGEDEEDRANFGEEAPKVAVQILGQTESKSMLESALDFKSKALYGTRIKRLNMTEYGQLRKKICLGKRRCALHELDVDL